MAMTTSKATGGNDVIFGNLGQDDIIGGSSDLFNLRLPTQRPDGSDLIFGGAGTDISRNNAGDATASASGDLVSARAVMQWIRCNHRRQWTHPPVGGVNGHAGLNAAEVTAGYAISGGFLNFNYDARYYPADTDAATLYDRIIRARGSVPRLHVRWPRLPALRGHF